VSLLEAVKKAKRVYIVGNGGSYANAIHMQNDLESSGIRAHTLNPASYSATANDCGHEFVFSRWIMLHGEAGDLLIAMSGSGESENILNAISAAELLGMDVYRIFGKDRGENMQEAEEAQIQLGHEVMKALRGRR
jgi:D-sedoheptulose 7-phosphate isomerase